MTTQTCMYICCHRCATVVIIITRIGAVQVTEHYDDGNYKLCVACHREKKTV